MDEVSTLDRFTENAKKVIKFAKDIAKQYGYLEVIPEHIFYSLLKNKNSLLEEITNRLGFDIESTLQKLLSEFSKNSIDKTPLDSILEVDLSRESYDILKESYVISFENKHVYVGSEHIFMSLFKLSEIKFLDEIRAMGITYDQVRKIVLSIATYPQFQPGANSRENAYQDSNLPAYTRNLNEIALNEGFPEIQGRDIEINRMVHILSRKYKNNPILVGEAGVGKTAIVEGLVARIINKNVPASMIDKKIYSLDISSVMSGARLRGDVEERINQIISEIIEDKNIILFIDEIHMIVGAGSSGGRDSLDVANILKPYLTGSDLAVIGATTYDEYSNFIESDSALQRRFQPIFVKELDKESSKTVLGTISTELEDFHGVKIKEEAIDAAVELSARFITDRYLPDKAIDLLDEAAASVKIGKEIAMEPELTKLGENLIKIQDKKEKAFLENNYTQASKYKEEEEQIIDSISDIIEGKNTYGKKVNRVVTEEAVKTVTYNWTKIPVVQTDITNKSLKNLNLNLKKRIIGQDRVIDNVVNIVQSSHLGLREPNRPLASFLFLGPTGVGKTELAKILARELFGNESFLFQINMSEYMEMHSVAKLIGAPPGYVGYQEGGRLTTFVKKRPYSVILFDEIEKAHPDTLNILLQILDEGILTDGKGNEINFKNTIVIMTSNIGAMEISTDSKLGFDIVSDTVSSKEFDEAYEEMKTRVMEQLKTSLAPELLNRIDMVDVFRGLNQEDSEQIARILVEDFSLRVLKNGLIIDVKDSVISEIAKKGYSREYGARNIKRELQDLLVSKLSKFLIEKNFKRKKGQKLVSIEVSASEGGEVEFVMNG